MSIAVEVFPVMSRRPCSFCLSLQGGSVFADFDKDQDGAVFVCRISFDGYGCCHVDRTKKMDMADSHLLLDAMACGRLECDEIQAVLLRYFRECEGIIWSDALAEHGLL